MDSIKINRHMTKQSFVNESVQSTKHREKHFEFQQILNKQIGSQQKLKFSKHALDRLETRNIKLTSQEIEKIDQAVNTAANKGVKETLILMNNRVFIANVQSKTIITAAVDDQLRENVFTNIDGAVII